MIEFVCWEPNTIITVENRKEAIKMIQKENFNIYKNVVVCIDNRERFNLESPRAKEYFGFKR